MENEKYKHLTDYELMSFFRDVFVLESKRQNVSMQTGYNFQNSYYDFYFPNGLSILDTHQPTIVQTKASKSLGSTKIESYARINRDVKFIVIHTGENDQEKEFNNYVRYLDFRFVRNIVERYPEIYSLYAGNYSKFEDIAIFDNLELNEQRSRNLTSKEISDLNASLYRNEYLENKSALILGNGVSIPFGSDGWKTLVDSLLDYLVPHGLKNPKLIGSALSNSVYSESSFADWAFSDKKKVNLYNKALRYCIYRKYDKSLHDKNSIIKAVAKAKMDKPNMPILTYNYDIFLEKQYDYDYHRYLGYYCGKDYLSHLKDSVIHLHGFLSDKPGTSPKNLVLTDSEYFSSYIASGGTPSWVYQAQRDILNAFSVLYVGSSMSDVFQLAVINDVFKTKKASKKLWNCYALMCLKDMENEDIYSIIQYYAQKGIKIIYTKTFDELITKISNLLAP